MIMLLVLTLAAVPACAASAAPAAFSITPEMDRALIDGVDDIYRMRFAVAEESARRAIALNPEHPHGYLGLAGVAWTRYVYDTDQCDDSLIKEYETRTAKAIDVGERWLKKNPKDASALMTVGAAYGLSSRLKLIRRQWFSGYFEGRKALKLTKAAVKAEPELWDAYLGLGMYDYYSDLYPRMVGVLAKVVLRGNRKRGIEYLRLVAEKGHYSRSNAQILLVEIYLDDPFGARDPLKALALMKELRAKYPDSAMMHSAQLVALFAAGRFSDVVDGTRDYLARVQSGRYDSIQGAKGHVILGAALWRLDRRDEALAAFREAQKIRFDGRMSRWAVWASIQAGKLEDALGRREDALKDYKLALAEPDRWGFRALAKPFLSKPYALPLPDRVDPPS